MVCPAPRHSHFGTIYKTVTYTILANYSLIHLDYPHLTPIFKINDFHYHFNKISLLFILLSNIFIPALCVFIIIIIIGYLKCSKHDQMVQNLGFKKK